MLAMLFAAWIASKNSAPPGAYSKPQTTESSTMTTQSQITASTCCYCGVGCGVVIESQGDQITGVRGAFWTRIAYITRLGEGILPRPDTVHQEGDLVHLVIRRESIPDVERILDGQPPQEV